MRKNPRKFFVLFSFLLAALLTAPAQGAEPHSHWSFTEAGLIPIQSGGRIKPIDSFAREAVLFVTGSRTYQGWNPVDLLFSWVADPKNWEDQELIQVSRQDVRRELGLDEKRTRFSPKELYQNDVLRQYAERMSPQAQTAPISAGPKQDLREQELRRVLDRLGTLRTVISGDAWWVIPRPAPAPWLSLAMATANGKEGDTIRNEFVELIRSYKADNEGAFARASVLARAAVEGEIPEWTEGSRRVIYAESVYNRFRPFLYAWIFYLTAALLWAFAIPKTGWLAKGITVAALFSHVFGISLRCYIAGRPPVTNMYESIIWVSLGVVIFALILFAIQRQKVSLAVACALACFGLIAGDAAPAMLDPGIHPLVPVLRSNYWLTIHVLTITLGYAAFALTLGLANVTLYWFLRPESDPARSSRILTLNQLTYRAMQFGVVLLAAGTILGGVWADYSWGRFWGWDPKEVWALTCLLCYLIILHGRYANWVGQFGFAAWSVISFLSVVMAWYGVNFVLGVGLHSYGFSAGGRGWVAGFVGLQLLYVGSVAAVRSIRKRARKLELTSSGAAALRSHPH